MGSGSSHLSCGVFLPLPLLQTFPLLFAEHVLLLLLAGLFVYSSCRKWIFPPLLWSFPSTTALQAFPLLVAGCTPAPTGASPARPGLFIYSYRKYSPPPLFGAQCIPPSLQHVFIVLIAYYSVSLFSPGRGWFVQGAMLFWPRVVCGSTAYHLAHLVCIFPRHLGMGDWWPGGPPGFSI
jgi:hypothetical protein